MTVFPLLAVGFIMKFIAVIWFICAVVLVLVILIQKGKGGGLSGALGGGMASGILGSKTGDFLTWFTVALVGIFLTFSVVMAKYYKPSISSFDAEQVQQTAPVPTEQAPVPAIVEEIAEKSDSNLPAE